MDAMVLEMLDLSRLEAGKVKLAQDRVELLGRHMEKVNDICKKYGFTPKQFIHRCVEMPKD